MQDPEIKFLSEELKNTTHHHKKYKTKFDIPISKSNYTDAHNNTHPRWAKPFFDKEYTSFDQIYHYENNSTAKPSYQELYEQFDKKAMCLKKCYKQADAFGITAGSHEKQKLYLDCKICCFKK